MGNEQAYEEWLAAEFAAGRDPDEELLTLLDDEVDEPSAFLNGDQPSALLDQEGQAQTGPSGCWTDDELVEALLASRRRGAREQYEQAVLTAEFGRRRRAQFAEAARHGKPEASRPGGFPGEELAAELLVTRAAAGHLIDDAVDLTSRLPRTLAGMAAGLIDAERAGWIAFYTRSLTSDDAAYADEILAAVAPDLRSDQLARKAAALELKLNPDGVKARREHARQQHQRVEARREPSGNAFLAGRELATADALAAKANIDAKAARLRASGLFDLGLDQLRALVFSDLAQSRDPLARIAAGAAAPDPSCSGGLEHTGTVIATDPSGSTKPGSSCPPGAAHPAGPAPLPALVNLIMPVGTLLDWGTSPAQAGHWGLLDRDQTRDAAAAAACHPRTRWCVTLTGPDGSAVAHGCASGPRPALLADLEPQPPPARLAELLRRLRLTFTPVDREAGRATGPDPEAEDRYVPSRQLRHLVRSRSATCDAPGCDAPALSADLDHTVPWPAGPTSQANLAPRCRAHHRAKQAPDWRVEQLAPGVTRWTLPSGRTHVTTPTRYEP